MRAECIIGAMMSQSRNFHTTISLLWLVMSAGTLGYATSSGAQSLVTVGCSLCNLSPARAPVIVLLQASDLETLINALQTKYDRLTSLAADFTQVYNARGERTRRESGTLLLKKPGRMRWDYT